MFLRSHVLILIHHWEHQSIYLVMNEKKPLTHKTKGCHRVVTELSPIDNFRVVRVVPNSCHGVPDDNLDNFLDDNH